MDAHLHIVSFNVPYPADYGGVIDVFYRIKALHSLGVKVHLHCFEYGRAHSAVLEKYCTEVLYYKRSMRWWLLLHSKPFIVASRQSNSLLNRIMQDDYPVLLEGLHCCALLEDLREEEQRLRLARRKVFVRMHNVEHDYYHELSLAERNIVRRLYLLSESYKLRDYEAVLSKATAILAVTENDLRHFRQKGYAESLLMPSSHENEEVVSLLGRGDYALYHADLSVPENEMAAQWLIKNVFHDGGHRLLVAGRNPSQSLSKAIRQSANVELIASPQKEEMQRLIANAQVIVMVTFQPTGLKLKLLNSLYAGRFCLVNSNMVAGTPLAAACVVVDSAEDMRHRIDTLMVSCFSEKDKMERCEVLGNLYDNKRNAKVLTDLLL